MILLYSESTSPRLQYTCSFIFKELLQADFSIITDAGEYALYEGVKINYSKLPLAKEELRVENAALLFESGITLQATVCFEVNGYKAFFKSATAVTDTDFPFDIFAAAFYLLSRYEEYLPHTTDMYGRYAHENSLAFREDFLQLPLINTWVNDFVKAIMRKFPAFNKILSEVEAQPSTFSFIPTYDIDIAYAYKHKTLLRTVGGFLKSPSLEKMKVLAGNVKDPFDVYDWLDDFHKQHGLQPIYFFLVAAKNAQYDKNNLPDTKAVKQLVDNHARKYEVGIHPSWQSGDNFLLMKKEKKCLQEIIGKPVTQSRQHYIRFSLPHSYRRLSEAGITDDYSMGYGSINGFRASVASSFYWYDLQKEVATSLRVHPFCFMDANSFYEQQMSPEQAYHELVKYYNRCKEVNGTLCTVWHNNFLGSHGQFAGWRQCYEKFIALVQQ